MEIVFTSTEEIDGLLQLSGQAVFVMPFIDQDQATKATKILSQRANFSNAVLVAIYDSNRDGFINAANQVYRLTESELFGYLASDAFPCRKWLEYSVSAFERNDIGLLGYNDGKWLGSLAAFGLAKRDWLADYYTNGVFHPGYHSHFADTELSVLAHATKKFGYNPNIVVMEVDYDKDSKPVNHRDQVLFKERMGHIATSRPWADPAAFNRFQ